MLDHIEKFFIFLAILNIEFVGIHLLKINSINISLANEMILYFSFFGCFVMAGKNLAEFLIEKIQK